jgi:type II secretory pathway pseudopilin PulG
VAVTNGFWMSFNELTADYPWLTKRMATAIAFRQNQSVAHPRRHKGAWLLAAIIPRFGAAGGATSMLLTVAMLGVLAAIAIPAYQDYTQRAGISVAQAAGLVVQRKVADFYIAQDQWPESMTDLGYEADKLAGPEGTYEIGIYQDGTIGVMVGTDASGVERYLVLAPEVRDGVVTWTCSGQNVPAARLPKECR